MNNKRLGISFEQYVCKILAKHGVWVHFMAPDSRGAQPFDIVAVKDGKAFAIECKTLDKKTRSFTLDRLEDNQRMAFQRWRDCGNGEPLIFVWHDHDVKVIEYKDLEANGKINMYGENGLWHLLELEADA